MHQLKCNYEACSLKIILYLCFDTKMPNSANIIHIKLKHMHSN